MEFPAIPDKNYFNISEAAFLCGVEAHVLRFWESKFTVLSPAKRRGGRRFYNHQDIKIIRHIRHLLYDKGFTIQGAKLHLQEQRQQASEPVVVAKASATMSVNDIVAELKQMLQLMKSE